MPKLSTETLVRVLTVVFTPVGAALTAFAGKAGLQLPAAAVVALTVATATAVLTMAWHWLSMHANVRQLEKTVDNVADRLVSAVTSATPAAGPALSEIEGLLKTHEAQVVDNVAKAVGAPPSVAQVADQVVQTLAGQQVAAAVAERKVIDPQGQPAPVAPVAPVVPEPPAVPPAA